MIVAISGKSGCGNTTVSGLLAERLGVKLINYTFHNLADEEGISFAELLERARTDERYDRLIDRKQVEMARSGDCVIGSRLAIWLLRDEAFTVYLRAREETRVARVIKREGGDYQAVAAFTRKRDEADHGRYLKLYDIDNDDYAFAELVIDVDDKSPEEIVGIILERLKK
jgi:cytidylate kinase